MTEPATCLTSHLPVHPGYIRNASVMIRAISPASFIFLVALLSARGQSGDDSSNTGPRWSLEFRLGFENLAFPFTLEFQSHLSQCLSVDAGMRPHPMSLYAGTSYYPASRMVVQLQAGYMKLSQPQPEDAPGFESDLYTGLRLGIMIGDDREPWFTISGGANVLLDTDYCSNCGFVDPTDFVPMYTNELSWTPFIELGARGFL